MKSLIIFLLCTTSLFAQYNPENRFEFDFVVDVSRLIEDKSEFDSGLNFTVIVNLDRYALLSPTIRFEAFPNLNFYRFGVGPEYIVHLPNLDLSAGVEVGQIVRKKLNLESYGSWWNYGFNGAMRIFLGEDATIVVNYSYLRRPDFQIYGTKPDFVGSLFIGIGYLL